MTDDTPNTWGAVDAFVESLFVAEDPALAGALVLSAEAGLPPIHVAPAQGKFLQLLARLVGARRVLEIGTLGGYSTIWLARALPAGGRVVTLEADPTHAAVARANFARAGLSEVIELREGPALDTLPGVEADGLGPFDLVFIDADKQSAPEYVAWAVRLARRGTAVVLDNVVRGGAVADPHSPDARVQGVRRAMELLAADPRVSATALQTVGAKGYDGFALAVVTEAPVS